ncbi:MAG: hypothetical protein KGL39_22815 [Patescibacteria group bacterium]|nr:hypothetical protein [Patescibacteria group bacterium]
MDKEQLTRLHNTAAQIAAGIAANKNSIYFPHEDGVKEVPLEQRGWNLCPRFIADLSYKLAYELLVEGRRYETVPFPDKPII